MTTTYYSTSPESVFSDQIKKERKAESSYLHSSSIKGSQSQQKGGMSFIVWVGTGWGSGHLKASRLFWKPTRICVANRLTCSARWRPACKLLCPSSEQVKIWEPQKIKAEMGQCSRFPDIKKKISSSTGHSCTHWAQQRVNICVATPLRFRCFYLKIRHYLFGVEKPHKHMRWGKVCIKRERFWM